MTEKSTARKNTEQALSASGDRREPRPAAGTHPPAPGGPDTTTQAPARPTAAAARLHAAARVADSFLARKRGAREQVGAAAVASSNQGAPYRARALPTHALPAAALGSAHAHDTLAEE